MNFFFRADASISIGTGHVIRCLTLAEGLQNSGGSVSFICREDPGNLIGYIEEKGYPVHRLPPGADLKRDEQLTRALLDAQQRRPGWLIVDHYGIDGAWESFVKDSVEHIMVIDDLANRKHACDLLLDQNYGKERLYSGLVPGNCVQLLGPRYALLRPQFREARNESRERDGEVKRIFVFMGGSDPTNETSKVLRAVQQLNRPDIGIDVVIGASNPYRDQVRALAAQMPQVTCHSNIENMAALMNAADAAIGACGTTTWERCCVGLPSIAIAVAINQMAIARELSEEAYLIYSGWYADVTAEELLQDLGFLIRHPEILRTIGRRTRALVDGRGVDRVIRQLRDAGSPLRLRPADRDDCPDLFHWRNHPEVRKNCFDPSPLSWSEHEQWFNATTVSTDAALLIGEGDSGTVGVLRYNFKGENAFVSIYLVPGNCNKGLGASLLRAGNAWIKGHHPEIKKIVAQVLPGNFPSFRAFENAGFRTAHHTYEYDCTKEVA